VFLRWLILKTIRRWAWKQPSFKESVIAHWSMKFYVLNERSFFFNWCFKNFLVAECSINLKKFFKKKLKILELRMLALVILKMWKSFSPKTEGFHNKDFLLWVKRSLICIRQKKYMSFFFDFKKFIKMTIFCLFFFFWQLKKCK